jgi:hypothetical protein
MGEVVQMRPVGEKPQGQTQTAEVFNMWQRYDWPSFQIGLRPTKAAARCYALLKAGKFDAAANWWREHIAAARRAGDGPFRRSDLDRIVAAYTLAVRAEIDRLKAEAADKGAG